MPRGVRKDPVDGILTELSNIQEAMVAAKKCVKGELVKDKKLLQVICNLAMIGGRFRLEELVGDLHEVESIKK